MKILELGPRLPCTAGLAGSLVVSTDPSTGLLSLLAQYLSCCVSMSSKRDGCVLNCSSGMDEYMPSLLFFSCEHTVDLGKVMKWDSVGAE